MRWGSNDFDAVTRMQELTLEELESIELTVEMARQWTIFYANEALRVSGNPSARGRAMLMRRAADLLGG